MFSSMPRRCSIACAKPKSRLTEGNGPDGELLRKEILTSRGVYPGLESFENMAKSPPSDWFTYSLGTLFVVITIVAVFVAVAGSWAWFLAGLIGVEFGLGAAALMLFWFAGRLERRDRKLAGFAVRLIGMAPMIGALLVFFVAMIIVSLGNQI